MVSGCMTEHNNIYNCNICLHRLTLNHNHLYRRRHHHHRRRHLRRRQCQRHHRHPLHRCRRPRRHRHWRRRRHRRRRHLHRHYILFISIITFHSMFEELFEILKE